MKLRRGMLTGGLCLGLLAAPHFGPVRAARAEQAPAGTAVVEDVDAERWWGIAGAVVCGVGMRVMRIPGIGLNPWVLAPTIGGCLLGMIDAFTSTTEIDA